MLKAGVVGVGHLGRHHARIYTELDGVRLDSISDTDPGRRLEVATRTGSRAFADYKDMIGRIDLVSIVVPTSYHLEVTKPFIEAGIHVLVEKPLAATVEDAQAICDLADKHNVILQVGHIERFNPAILEAQKIVNDPRYVVADRIAPYSFRSGDIGVVLDLMIHDLDIILQLIPSAVKSVEALGLPVMSQAEDIADARIWFENGALADLKTSRVSFKRMRKIRFFQSDAYLSIDYNDRKIWVYRKKGKGFDASSIDPHSVEDPLKLIMDKYLTVEELSMGEESDALTMELSSFLDACRGYHPPAVTGEHGLRAVKVARIIQSQIHQYLIRESERVGVAIPDFIRNEQFPEP
jgi:predicted dehydrogenase